MEVNRSVRNKAHRWVFAALQHVIAAFPFPIIGIDSDNGSEFINAHLLTWCQAHEVTFTRSRPGNKNDGAHVEQKNWSRVRELVGYYRYDTPTELEVLNQIWTLDASFTNHWLPQQKLVSKQCHGAKVTKHYDTATTPYRRADCRADVSAAAKQAMNTTHSDSQPAALSRQIITLTGQLEALAQAKKAPRSQPLTSRRHRSA